MNNLNIDKTNTYVVDNFMCKNFINLSDEEIRMVLEWRNAPVIRQSMYNTDEISYESHRAYIENLKDRDDRYYWLVFNEDKPFGVIDLIDVDKEERKSDFGYYIRPDAHNSGEGLQFVYAMFKFFFSLGIEELHSSVHINNKKAIVIDKYFGSRFREEDTFEMNGEKYVPFELPKAVFEKKFK